MRRAEALPCLVAALADDVARPAAEEAMRRFGRDAVPALLTGAMERAIRDGSETESSHRRRRAALALLLDIDVAVLPLLRAAWVNDDDPEIAVLGCRLVLRRGDAAERRAAIQRLVQMLPSVHWRARHDIEDCLAKHAADARPAIRAAVPAARPGEDDRSPEAAAQRSLLRIAHRLRL